MKKFLVTISVMFIVGAVALIGCEKKEPYVQPVSPPAVTPAPAVEPAPAPAPEPIPAPAKPAKK